VAAAPQRVAFVAHCMLNQNAKVDGGALCRGVYRPLVDALRAHGYRIEQMPCPELAYLGLHRFWIVKEQLDTTAYRRHCRRLAKLVAAVMEPHLRAGDDVVLIGIDSSPTMGVEFSPSSPTWGGEPNIGEDDSRLVPGGGIFVEELEAELAERGLELPPRTGVRHWFARYDPEEERRRIEALLT